MTGAIGVRFPDEILKKADYLGRSESEDRSTIIRKAVTIGLNALLERKAANDYVKGRITFSEAARRAGLTIWEMEQYLVANGYKSAYSVEDLERELRMLENR